ncbi:serine/threonine-protein kinase ATG1c-like isoform X2 [Phalaenopsis equestris]|uniref:serine/threonine-protein kinase ATG1c-like isoform X2 n=1 Tax=Phalaenopsis equestris TaxID=78828 RepID=UPI0009E31775|nr:serine/threonine-protein kinase ATG1c-like isoform X2 [Phalaenopsis equestris]
MASGSGSGYCGGRMVGDYIFGRQIGSGSFSVVWLARHRVHGVEVAIKEIVMERLSKKLQESLLSEIVILKRIKHPNIIAMHDIIKASGRIYLILEYCRGGDLSLYLQRHGRVSEATAKHFMQQLASGLQVLHDNNLIHRDLKPQNLLLSTTDDNSVLKIADFGFARSLQPLGLAETLCGSPLYMAPEIMQLQKYDAKADLWSVGAILFQLVTGRTPFTGNTQIQLLQNIMKSNDLHFPPDSIFSDYCIDLCKRLLRRNPVERLTFEEFFNHQFLSESKLDESLRTACVTSSECIPRQTLSFQEDCMPFPLEDESGGPDQSFSAHMSRSVRSTYGFHVGENKDSSSNTPKNLGILSKHSLPNKMEKSFYHGHKSYRELSGNMKQTNVSIESIKHDHTILDPLDLVDQEYVIVSGHALEMPSSSLSFPESQFPPCKPGSSPMETKKNFGLSAPVPIVGAAITKIHTIGSLESRNSSVSGTSQGSFDIGDAIEQPSVHCITRIRSLQQCCSVISELVKGESENGRQLEAFSVQLVLLAIWKQALNICHTHAAIEGCSSLGCKSQDITNASPGTRHCLISSGSQVPDSLSSNIEREFLLSVEHAEELEKGVGQLDEATEMPDAIEIIYRSALALGRLGAVDEMMKNMERAEDRYSKAACLLHFLLAEAPSLVLNPPLSLTSSDRFRLRTYFDMISNRRCQSRIASP